MINAESAGDTDGTLVLHRRDGGSYERPKNIWTRAEALRNRIHHARRHVH